MLISASIRERALLDLFELNGCAGGRPLLIARIAEAWPNTGLRREDLDAAIEDLRESGCLVSSSGAEGAQVRLTPLGVEFLGMEPRDPRELSEQLRIRRVLVGVARRSLERTPPVPGRRAADLIAAMVA